MAMMERDQIVRLLHEVDGQLGLAIYRNEGNQIRWKQEATDLLRRIRETVESLEGDDEEDSMSAQEGPITPCHDERPGRCRCSEQAGHHGRHRCNICGGDWENKNETNPCLSTEVATLGALEPNGSRLRCGLLDGHDGPHRFGITWR